MIAHGMAHMLQESMMARADAFELPVCDGCGGSELAWDAANGRHVCGVCDGGLQWVLDDESAEPRLVTQGSRVADVSAVHVPYAFHLLHHELRSLGGIGMQLLTERGALAAAAAPST